MTALRVLGIGAHPDDVELGAGGTLAKHVRAGDDVRTFAFGGGRDEQQVRGHVGATKALGVALGHVWEPPIEDQRFDKYPLRDLIHVAEIAMNGTYGGWRPDVVYTHSAADLNRDHRIVHEAVLVACRPIPGKSHPKRLLAFEVPGTTEIGMGTFRPSVFVDVSGEPLSRKLKALACYASEMREFPHPRSMFAVQALASWRGASAGLVAAEAFELVRDIA